MFMPLLFALTACNFIDDPELVDVLDDPPPTDVPLNDVDYAWLDVMSQAIVRYPGEDFIVITVRTVSKDLGTDNWRSCAKLTPAQFGLPSDTIAFFFDQSDRSCTKNPAGLVMSAVFAGPPGMQDSLVEPTYKSERVPLLTPDVFKAESAL